MIKHYKGELGEFDYDDKEFEVSEGEYHAVSKEGEDYYVKYKCLKYIGKGLSVNLPRGCTSTKGMFKDCELPEGFTLGPDFDTSNVTNMSRMFYNCTKPKGFSLGDKFNTSNVTDMSYMFSGEVAFDEGSGFIDFSFGDKFDTSNVTNMSGMFEGCTLSKGFSFGDKFDTSKVTDMSYMFYECSFEEDFSFGDKFDTSSVTNMSGMFGGEGKYNASKNFSLGDKFDTSNVTDMSYMFDWFGCENDDGWTLGDKFDTSKVTNMDWMFRYAGLPKDLGNKFNTINVKTMSSMFMGSYMPEGFSLGDKFDTSNVENMMGTFSCIIHEDFSLPDNFTISGLKDGYDDSRGYEYTVQDVKECMFDDYDFGENTINKKFKGLTAEEIIDLLKGRKGELIKCQKAMLKLLKEGKTLKEAEEILSSSGLIDKYKNIVGDIQSIGIDTAKSLGSKVEVQLKNKCSVAAIQLLSIEEHDGFSNYTIGEVQDILIGKGFPKDIVNECILNYIKDEYISK